MAWNLNIGDKASVEKVFTELEVTQFAEISTDRNPLHLDDTVAQQAGFKGRIVHGMLVASLFSGLLGQKLPGVGTIYLGQQISFKAPVLIGEKIVATVEVAKIREDKPIITLKTICTNAEGTIVVEGEAVVKAPSN